MKETKQYKALRLEKEQVRLITNLAEKLDITFSKATRLIINKYFKQ